MSAKADKNVSIKITPVFLEGMYYYGAKEVFAENIVAKATKEEENSLVKGYFY